MIPMDALPNYEAWFEQVTGHRPHPWQQALGEDPVCEHATLRLPTGFGKTLGLAAAWAYHRLVRGDEGWPRRLIWTLPMRALVDQVAGEIDALLRAAGVDTPVYILMGGRQAHDWHLHPERPAVLVGTQDMLLSRALNRGYGLGRARWPIDFGLVNQDALWVLDEVQLMDVGLATAAQLQAFRDDRPALRRTRTWFCSATLQRRWLETPDTGALLSRLSAHDPSEADRRLGRWAGTTKPLVREPSRDRLAERVLALQEAVEGERAFTLVVLNTVDRAVELHRDLAKLLPRRAPSTQLHLAHSRFRPAEREAWPKAFLSRQATASGRRILVATQVVEAGVDLNADLLVTEVAPWPSLVQRFGRVARDGGRGLVHVFNLEDDKLAPPYDPDELAEAWAALERLEDVAPAPLEALERAHPELLPVLYPYQPRHLLLPSEVDDLFDTSPDLSGADLDVSRFIREGAEKDVLVAWRDVPPSTAPPLSTPGSYRPTDRELCAVTLRRASEWLCGPESQGNRLRDKVRAWIWDYLSRSWVLVTRDKLYPGQVVVVAQDVGGYHPERGFTGQSSDAPPAVLVPDLADRAQDLADEAEEAEELSAFPYRTVATHGLEVGQTSAGLAQALGLDPALGRLMHLAGRWHDLGKTHAAFQASIRASNRPDRQDLAKAPKDAWLEPRKMYPAEGGQRRRGFRHELASALALFSALRVAPLGHPARAHPWRESAEDDVDHVAQNPLIQEVLSLGYEDFNLLVWLVVSHHGKVRVSWQASPADQQAFLAQSQPSLRGVRDAEPLPTTNLASADGVATQLPSLRLHLSPARLGLDPLTGPSWTDRVLSLRARWGVFALAFLEATFRAADVRASRLTTPDPLLREVSS
jgi:CRISPR-associated endonuclease/helicase Cas3